MMSLSWTRSYLTRTLGMRAKPMNLCQRLVHLLQEVQGERRVFVGYSSSAGSVVVLIAADHEAADFLSFERGDDEPASWMVEVRHVVDPFLESHPDDLFEELEIFQIDLGIRPRVPCRRS